MGEIASWIWFNPEWEYRKKITIDHKNCLNKDLRNFPVLISLKNPDLRFTAHGGHIAQSQGEDILFTSSDGKTKLAHEIEKYESATGELKAWVRVPLLSHARDTILYLYYGNSTCESQQNKNGVWDSNYKMVLHLNETSDTHLVPHSPSLNIYR